MKGRYGHGRHGHGEIARRRQSADRSPRPPRGRHLESPPDAGSRGTRAPSIINRTDAPILVSVADKPSIRVLCCEKMAGDMERALGALRDFTRRDILLRFYADRKPRSVEDVARESGVHRSVAFEHLERLVALGYLEVAHRRGLPGKPAKIYKLTGGPVQISHPMRRYDIVAESLGRAFDELGDVGSHAVRRAGRNFGESIASGGARSAMAALEPMLEMGAEYEMDRGGIIQCNNCLFAEVCRRAPGVCRFHAGILHRLFMHTEPNVSVQAPRFCDPYGCAYMLQESTLGQELEAEAL